MATRGINKLSALQVKKAKPDPDKMYKLSDGEICICVLTKAVASTGSSITHVHS
jgi:hypothetical protein